MIITRTPLRISFAGGGSDIRAFYRDEPGAVLSTTINKYIHITVSKHWDHDRIRLAYSVTENVMCADELQHELVRQALLMTGIHSGIEITSISDIPSRGSGLGSSSAYTVGMLNALANYKGEAVTNKNLAKMACRIEIDNLGKPIGKQDQYACAIGGLHLIEFMPDENVVIHPVRLTMANRIELENRLMLFYTGLTRKSDGILAKQSENTRNDKKTRDNLRAMANIARQLKCELDEGNIDTLGFALLEGWERKKKLADGISNSIISDVMGKGIRAGALGGKVLGAGGGGFILFYAKPENHEAIREAVKMRQVPFRFDDRGTYVLYSRTE
jgi:D-glycero-alpha-D-manno-heptose-7-phosphate kinase